MQDNRFLPKGAATVRFDSGGPPKKFHFLLLPKTTMLAFSAAIEPLRIANQLTQKPLFEWHTLSPDGQPVSCSNGIPIQMDTGLVELDRNASLFVCAGTEPAQSYDSRVVSWISRQKAHGVSVGSICTGAFALAAAGVLTGRRFTLHWENSPGFAELFPCLEPTGNFYEADRGLYTCGGGHAATDMMLEIIEDHCGAHLASCVAEMCLHKRPGAGMSRQITPVSPMLGCRNQNLIRAVRLMQANLEEPLDIDGIAETLAVSRRQLERLFQKYVGQSPWKFYFSLRLDRAFSLLNETDLSVREVAMASGFESASYFSRQFKRKFERSPHSFRKSWSLHSSAP